MAEPGGADAALTYTSYLALDEVLGAQRPRSDEHDELLFIVVHQVYELWFKQLLHEVAHAQRGLEAHDTAQATHALRRILTILKVVVAQIDVLETMTPLEFLSFRSRLEAARGFQSDQFRQIEFMLGRKSRAAIERFPEGSRARQALVERWGAATVWDAFLAYLEREGYAIPAAQRHRDVTASLAPDADLQAVLVSLYRTDPKNGEVCERLVDLDEGVQEWRYRHVKMVERTIGTKPGTGGSSGAAYLQSTVGAPLFPDLWAIRGVL